MNDKKKSQGMGPGELTRPIVTAPSAMIEFAISKGADLEKLEKILELQERFERNEAKKAYHVAMTEFKKNPPEILKDRKVSFGEGKTSYHHATLANVCEKVIEGLSKHGLSHGWKTDQTQENKITVECVITHSQGHGESTKLSAEPDTSGSKNKIQAMGSTITYLERYTLLALTGLATFDMDDNGNTAGSSDYITEEQVKIIELLAEETNSDVPKWMKVESIGKILASDFKKVEAGLRAKVKEQRQPGE